jgi:3-deoxy-D-manno-octulosonate 8-phosphate phosphatase KdsC-like HAD superfamily phosphatase
VKNLERLWSDVHGRVSVGGITLHRNGKPLTAGEILEGAEITFDRTTGEVIAIISFDRTTGEVIAIRDPLPQGDKNDSG